MKKRFEGPIFHYTVPTSLQSTHYCIHLTFKPTKHTYPMKKFSFLATISLLMSMGLMAQHKAYLNGNAGYTFDESFIVQTFNGRFMGNAHYGGSVELELQGISNPHNESTIEIAYLGMQTVLDGWVWPIGQNAPSPATYNVTLNYITAGFNNYFGHDYKIMGFGGLNMGAGWMSNQTEPSRPSNTRFSIGLKGGGRFMFSEKVGLKLYAQLNTIVEGVGGGFYFGTGGSGAAVTTFSSVVQFGLGGGLTVGLGGKPQSNANNQRR
jgi:hypothetical protein